MAQTTGATSFKNVAIEISTNGSSWTNISGFANAVKVSGGERQTAEFFTADGDTPILTAGKRASIEVAVTAVHTEGGGEPAEVIRAAYEGSTPIYVRWTPKGLSTGNYQYTTSAGILTTPSYPQGDASTPDVVPLEFTIKVLTVTKGTAA